MRLTHWTDYTLRVLLFCAATQNREKAPTVSEIATLHQISKSHLMKIVMELASNGLLVTSRGRGGGIRLLKPANQIVVGDVVRQTETDFDMVECFNHASNSCKLDGRCKLKSALQTATKRYLETLDELTIADLLPTAQQTIKPPKSLKKRP